MAEQAFQQGKHKEAFNFLFAEWISNDREARENYDQMKWVAGLYRPALAVRWGIGIEYNSGNYKGDPRPIGSGNQTARGGGGRGNDGPGFEPSTAGAGAGGSPGGPGGAGGFPGGYGDPTAGGGTQQRGQASHPAITRYAGDLGAKVLERLEQRLVETGSFGSILQQMAAQVGGGGGGGGQAGYGAPGGYGAGGPGGYGGAGGYPGAPGAPGAPGIPGGYGAESGQAAAADGIKQLLPGLVFVGQAAKKDELLKTAQEQELDVLLVIEVDVAENRRTGMITNNSKVLIYNVQTGEIYRESVTRLLNNIQVEREREKNGDRADAVDKALDPVFAFIDAQLTLGETPEVVTAEATSAHLPSLANEDPSRLLQRLNEIRFYRSRNLLNNEQLESSYQQIIGDEGRTLALGSAAQKKKAMEGVLSKLK
jgi:hypothetical protein